MPNSHRPQRHSLIIVSFSLLLLLCNYLFLVVANGHPDYVYSVLMILDVMATVWVGFHFLRIDLNMFDEEMARYERQHTERTGAGEEEHTAGSEPQHSLLYRIFIDNYPTKVLVTVLVITMISLNIGHRMQAQFDSKAIPDYSLSSWMTVIESLWDQFLCCIKSLHNVWILCTDSTIIKRLLHFAAGCCIMVLVTVTLSRDFNARQRERIDRSIARVFRRYASRSGD